MDADGYLLVLLTPVHQSAPADVVHALRLAVRVSPGGVLALGGNLAPGTASPVAVVTRRLADGQLVGATTCFGPLTAATAGVLGAWLRAGGPAVGRPPEALDTLRLTPLALAAASASRN